MATSAALARDAAPIPFAHPDNMPELYTAPGVGDCMMPLIAADSPLAFDKRAEVRPGDVVVLWFTPAAARRIGSSGWVKRLLQPLPPAGMIGLIVVEMLNPLRVLRLRSDDVLAVHRCIGTAPTPISASAAISSVSLRALPSAMLPEGQMIVHTPQLEIFQQPHPTTIVHAVHDNRNAPLLRAGEIAVVESDGRSGWNPVEGGLFLIEYVSKPLAQYDREKRSREIVQTFRNTRGDWCAGSMRRGSAVDGMFFGADGPYRDENDLADKLIGRVVGILEQTLLMEA